MRSTVLVVLCLTASVASADTPDQDAADWEAAIRDYYRHYASVEIEKSRSTALWFSCKADGATDDERVEHDLALEPWALRVTLESPSVAFPNVYLIIGRPTSRKLLGRLDGCDAGKRSIVLVEAGDQLVLLSAPCRSTRMLPYDAGDLLDLVTARGLTATRVWWSPCGRMELDAVTVAEIRKQARKKRSLWGKSFPTVRTDAKAAAR